LNRLFYYGKSTKNRIQIFRWPLVTTRRIGNRPFLRNIVLECMPDCKEKLAYNVPFTIVILICYIWPATIPWEIIRKVWLLVLQRWFIFDETLQRQIDSKLTFNSLKEIDVPFVNNKFMRPSWLTRKSLRQEDEKYND
jgi:hypothetical protein